MKPEERKNFTPEEEWDEFLADLEEIAAQNEDRAGLRWKRAPASDAEPTDTTIAKRK